MKVWTLNGQDYRLPNELSDFKLQMYVHLTDWKWAQGIREPGHSEHRGQRIPYDAILPEDNHVRARLPHIYPGSVEHLRAHHTRNPFRFHNYFYHMSSSQAANINLFLPILHHPDASKILAAIPGAPRNFATLATAELDNGYCLEFWGGNFGADPKDKGPLGDKSSRAGTDVDLAIAYHNTKGELCLWLIEHKLVEDEFTTCGGYRSKGRTDKARHDCSRNLASILESRSTCYYHDKCGYLYWDITAANRSFFAGTPLHDGCPFQGGLNQLWRNQLMGLAIESQGNKFSAVHFSVVRHPENTALDASLAAYRQLIADNPRFSSFTSADVVGSAKTRGDANIETWVTWYERLYKI